MGKSYPACAFHGGEGIPYHPMLPDYNVCGVKVIILLDAGLIFSPSLMEHLSNQLRETAQNLGLLLPQELINNRKTENGIVVKVLGGILGDYFLVRHESGEIAIYCFNELRVN
jgi:hypothetical protein